MDSKQATGNQQAELTSVRLVARLAECCLDDVHDDGDGDGGSDGGGDGGGVGAAEGAACLCPTIIHFEARLGTVKLFVLQPEAEKPAVAWNKLAEACSNLQPHILDWYPCNGETSITVQDSGVVAFVVARYGDGQGGRLETQLPVESCVAAFRGAGRIAAEREVS